jgi:hypothetical protein
MSFFIEKDGKKRLSVSFYVKILIFLGITALSIFFIQPVYQTLKNEMFKIRDFYIGKLEDITGTKIRYSSIRPSIFGSLNIKSLSFNKGDIPVFTVSQVKIHFSLWELIRRKKTFIHTVDIERPEINIDTERNAAFFELISSLNNNEKSENNSLQITELIPVNANYKIHHLNFSLTDKQTVYKIHDMNISLKERDGEITLIGRFNSEYKKGDLFGKTIIVNVDSGINGVCSFNFDNASAEFSVYDAACYTQENEKKTSSFIKPVSNNSTKQKKLFNLSPFKTFISYNDNLITVKPYEENKFNNYNFNYDIKSKKSQAGIKLTAFKPKDLIKFSDEIKNISDMLSMQITGDTSFSYDNELINYIVDIKGENANKSSTNNDSFVIDVKGNEKSIIVNDFYITSANSKNNYFSGTMGVSGNLKFKPLESNGTVFFENFSLTGKEDFNAVFNIYSNAGDIKISGSMIEIAQALINDFTIVLHPQKNGMDIDTLCSFAEGGTIGMEAIYRGSPQGIEASLNVDSLSLFQITEVLRPFYDGLNAPVVSRGILKKTSLRTEIFFNTDFNNIVYNAPNIVFNSENTKVLMSLSGTDKKLTLSEGLFSNNENELVFSSDIDFSNAMDLEFLFNANYHEMTWRLEGQVLDRKTLIVRDPNGFHGYGNISSNGAISGYIESINYPILANSKTIYLNFYSSLRYNSPDFWQVNINNFAARYSDASEDNDFLKISGMADQNGASFRKISYVDNYGMLLGNADFSWDENFSYIYFILNITDGNEAGENYYAEGKVKDKNVNVDVSVSDMHLNRFIKKINPVTVSADASVSWDSIESFDAKIKVSSLSTRIDENDLYAVVSANVSNNEINVINSYLEYFKVKTTLSDLNFNILDGVTKINAGINGILNDKYVNGDINIDAKFASVNSWLDLKEILTDFEGELLLNNFVFGDVKDDEFKLVFAGKDGALSVKGGKKDMIRLEMDSSGVFFAGLSAPLPIHGNVVGTLKKGILDSHTNYFFIDLPKIFNIFSAQQDFLITGGYITGKAKFIGPFWNPEFHGTAKAESLRFVVPNYLKDDIRVAPVDVIAEGYEMSFAPVNVLSGSGSGTVKGWFIFENWQPTNIGVDVSILREKPLSYGLNIIGFLANGNASGNLNINFDITNTLLELKGDIFTNESELGLNMDEIGANMESDNSSEDTLKTIVNLKVTTGSMVEFIWPSSGPILRAMPERGTVLLVTCDTEAGQYSVNSNIKIRSGELYYFDRSFYIRQGNMVLKENENQFDPKISARAEIRERAESGPVTISMIIENQPLFSFEPRFESNPGMTQLEIYSILGQNFNIVRGDENNDDVQRLLLSSTTDLATQFIASSDVFSQVVFMRQIERQVRNFFNLDMFSVRTRFIQNAIVTGASAGLSQFSGQNTVDRNRVGNYLIDNTSIFIGKYIGQDMFIQLMGTLKYDEKSIGGLKFEPDIGIELQSPFINQWSFNIRWDFYPYYHPENFWINDSSITLIWSKSY